MGEKLAHPPLVEALCEFRFLPTSPWDLTIPGQLYERIKDEFTERAQLPGFGVEIQSTPRLSPVATIHSGPERVQLRRPDGSAMVQVGEHLLAINQLPPYPTWEVFVGLIGQILGEYWPMVGEARLARIGLRYINQIPVHAAHLRVGDYLTLVPPLAGGLDRPLASFYQRYELSYDRPFGLLIHQTGTRRSDEMVLDLDFSSTLVQGLATVDEVRRWLDAAHERVYEAFVASLDPDLLAKLKQDTA